jgi:hypothetical protein
MRPTGGAAVYEIHLTNCWSGGTDYNNGFDIVPDSTSGVFDVMLIGHQIAGCYQNGLHIECTSPGNIQRITITGGYFSANGREASTYAGINFVEASNDTIISGASMQPTTREHPGGPQGHAIAMSQYGGTGSGPLGVIATGCDMSNYSPPGACFAYTYAGFGCWFADNPGFNPIGGSGGPG